MSTTPYPVPRSTRQTDILVGNGGKVYGPFDGLQIFDNEDVVVYSRATTDVPFSPVPVTVAKVSGLSFDFFTIEFSEDIPATTEFIVSSERIPERSAGVKKGTMLDSTALEKELSKIATTEQELRRDVGRALKVGFGQEPQDIPLPEAGKVLGWSTLGKLTNLLLAGVGSVVFGAAGLAIAATATFEETRSVLDAKYVVSADKTGATDASFALANAVATQSLVRLPAGSYRIAQNLTIPKTCQIEFDNGAKLIREAGIKVTFNSRPIAGSYQPIFGGPLVDSSYIRIGDAPYDFGFIGGTNVGPSSPFWFEAGGDGIVDDQLALHCALYFSNVMYIPPKSIFLTSIGLHLRRADQTIYGEGEIKSSGASIGQVLGFRGDPPTTASGPPARFVTGGRVIGITIDGADAVNNNGTGGQFAKDCAYINVKYKNIGRKAITWQYWCQHCWDEGCSIVDAAQELGSTHAAISIEGQTAGLNYSLDGGVASANDMFGEDTFGIRSSPKSILSSGYNYLVIQRARDCVVDCPRIGDCFGSGSHVVLGAYAKNNKIHIQKAGNTERRFVFCDVLSSDNDIYINGGDAAGTGSDGYSVHDQGARNKISGSCDHSNASTTNSRAIELAGAGGKLEFHVKSCDSTTVIGGGGTDVRLLPGTKVEAAGKRSVLAGGTGWRIKGDYDSGTATGVQINASNGKCRGAILRGDGPNRGLVSSGVSGAVFQDNDLPGVNPTIDWTTLADLWASGVKFNNPGDISTYHCARMGGRIDGSFGGTPEGVITAAVGSTIRDTAGGNVYRKGSGSGNTGWVAM